MRAVTWNAQHGVPTPVGRPDLARALPGLAGLGADVMAVQELDRGRMRSDRADQPGLLADALGMSLVWGPALRIRGDYGVALLVRGTIASSAVHLLPGPGEPRVLVEAEVVVADRAWTVGATHLSTDRAVSEDQLAAALGLLEDRAAPRLLLGDLNLEPGPASRVAGVIGYRVVTGPPTHSARARHPSRRIDHVLVDGGVRVERSTAERLPVSDHLAVVVDLDLAT